MQIVSKRVERLKQRKSFFFCLTKVYGTIKSNLIVGEFGDNRTNL